jgi:hypothetical protein
MIEVLKQMQEALREYHYYTIDAGLPNQSMLNKGYAAYQAGKQAIAELESQKPIAYVNVENRRLEFATDYVKWDTPTTIKLDKIPLYTHPPQRTWVGLTDDDWKEIEDMPDTFDQGVAWAQARLERKNT